MSMRVYEDNRAIFLLPEWHPAHRFLREFILCREACVGRDIPSPPASDPPVDQEWYSPSERRTWTFSGFAYAYLAFDIVLDGWLDNSPHLTASEDGALRGLPHASQLLDECESACVREGNDEVRRMVGMVRQLFVLWEECIRARISGTEQKK